MTKRLLMLIATCYIVTPLYATYQEIVSPDVDKGQKMEVINDNFNRFDNEVVHKFGNELVHGKKLFTDNMIIGRTGFSVDQNGRSLYVYGDMEVYDTENKGIIYTNPTQLCGSGFKSFELTYSTQSFEWSGCGNIKWGPGSGPLDTFLERLNPHTLKVSDNLVLVGTITLNSQTYTFPSNSGTSGNVLTTNGSGTLSWGSSSSSSILYQNFTSTQSNFNSSPYTKLYSYVLPANTITSTNSINVKFYGRFPGNGTGSTSITFRVNNSTAATISNVSSASSVSVFTDLLIGRSGSSTQSNFAHTIYTLGETTNLIQKGTTSESWGSNMTISVWGNGNSGRTNGDAITIKVNQ